MSAETLATPTMLSAATQDLLHLVCPYDCDNNLAYCGLDVTGEDWAEHGDLCIVCDELDREGLCVSATCPGRAA